VAQPSRWRWTLGLSLAVLLAGVPFLYYRYDYTYAKRLREVDPGRVYRSGQMTAPGFEETVARLGIHTIINLQNEYPDPDIALGYFTGQTIKESELCQRLGVRYVFIDPDLISRRRVPAEHPRAIDDILKVLDDPASYPVLLHCRAGLHRTGIMTAVYRMEYQRWSPRRAVAELKANGFSEWQCSAANDYVTQYVLTYQPREGRNPKSEIRNPKSE
jgi:hypothetical protein